MNKKIEISIIILFSLCGLFLLSRVNCNEEKTVKQIVKEEDSKAELIEQLIKKVDELSIENASYKSEVEDIQERKDYYKKQFQNFELLDTVYKTVFFNCDTVEITREIQSEVNKELIVEIQSLKRGIKQMKSKHISDLSTIAHEFTEKTVKDVYKTPVVRYKFSIVGGYGVQSDLKRFNPSYFYNAGLTYDFNKKIGIGTIGGFNKDYANISIILKYNFNR
jgi:hypothetical protein